MAPALAGFLVAAGGCIALGLSLLLPAGSSTAATEAPGATLMSLDQSARPAQAKRASEAQTIEEPDPPSAPALKSAAAAPPIRAPAPMEARPVVQARSVGPPALSSSASTGGAAASTPFSVVITPGLNAPPGVSQLAAGLVKRLSDHGIVARLAGLADAGRPDAILVLGTRGDGAAEAWYCDPGPSQGVSLAKLLDATTRGLQTNPPAATAADGPQSPFPCDEVQAGRARVAAALLELPPGMLQRPELGERVSDAVARYFSQNAAAVRTARIAARLVWPASGPITSPYGPSHPLGIDIGEFQGNILAATEGTVAWSGGNPCCSYGLYVVIDSKDGIRTLYAHLASLAVKKGQQVRQGQVLGAVGCTGNCTGPHLHFEVIDKGVRQNPMKYLP